MSSSRYPMMSSTMFLALFITFLFVTPAYSTSRRALDRPKPIPKGFQVGLKRVDSAGNLTRFELVQRAMKRGRKRMEKLSLMVLSEESDPSVESPIHAGNGEFLMELAIGTPKESFNAIMDTGSDLIWTQCKPCKECFDQSTPIFDPKKSSSFSKLSCSSTLCSAVPSSCGDDGCEYVYMYGDYSSTQGVMATEMFTFDKVSIPNVAFGCGVDNEGSGFNQGSGLVGLGRGPLSLVSQLDEPKFSYCLTSIDAKKKSTLLMGSLAGVNTTGNDQIVKTTPLIKNPLQPSFYYLALEGITVGETLLPIEKSTFALNSDGSGGMIIDSGTTITYLEESAFDLLKQEFSSQMKLPVDDSSSTGLDLCFKLPSNANDVKVPKLIFHFTGTDLDLAGENYIIADSDEGVACLAMGGSSGMSIFGNTQQQNMLVLHDLKKETISFIPTQCDKL